FLGLKFSLAALGVVYVVGGTGLDRYCLLFAQLTHLLAGGAHDQGAIGNVLALGNQRVGADDAVAADLGAIEDHGIDADQAVVAHGAAVQHGLVSGGDVLAEDQRNARIGMHDGPVLDVAVLTDQDELAV